MTHPFIIIGAGGHAKVLADALCCAGLRVLGFTDSNPALHGSALCGYPVLGNDDVLSGLNQRDVFLANGIGHLGQNPLRRQAQEQLQSAGWRFPSIVHPRAIVSRFAHLGEGIQIMAGSIVQPDARIGTGCIINTAAIVEHDVVLGDFCHLAPAAILCGNVEIGTGSHIGAGAVIKQGGRLGPRTTVGAGAVVVGHFSGNVTLIGVPAKPIDTQESAR